RFRRPPRLPLFPYTTLFRSVADDGQRHARSSSSRLAVEARSLRESSVASGPGDSLGKVADKSGRSNDGASWYHCAVTISEPSGDSKRNADGGRVGTGKCKMKGWTRKLFLPLAAPPNPSTSRSRRRHSFGSALPA